jgi:hypothetical protein
VNHIRSTVAVLSALVLGASASVAQPPTSAAHEAFNLPRLSVDLHNAPLADVTAALTKATGVVFTAGSGSRGTFTLSVKDRPFWDIFEELSRQTALAYAPSPNGIEIGTRAADGRAVVSGPLLVQATVAAPGAAGGAARGPGAARRGPVRPEPVWPEGTRYVLTLTAIGDPRLLAGRRDLDVADVRDENGRPFKVLAVSPKEFGPVTIASTGPWNPRTADYDLINSWSWDVALAPPDGGGRTIASLRGSVAVRASVKNASVTLDDVENKHLNVPTAVGNWVFTLRSFIRRPDQSVTLRFDAEVARAVDGAAGGTVAPLRVAVLDARGQTVATTGAVKSDRKSIVPPRGGGAPSGEVATPPFRVVLTASERMEETRTAFEIKGLPLP